MEDEVIWGVPSFWMERFPLYYGRRMGFFQERGISLKIKYFWGGPELARAVNQGAVELGEMGLPAFCAAFARGSPARIIGSSTIQQLDHYLVSRPEIRSMGDLKGKRVGILSQGSCDDYFIRRMLEACSVNPDSEVELVPLGKSYGDLTCFSSGRVDAGFLVEPNVALGESMGLVKILASVKEYFPRYQWGIIFARNDILQDNLDLADRALEAYRESCRSIKENLEAALWFGAQVFRMKKNIFRIALQRDLANWELDARVDLVGLENCLRLQEQAGAIPCGLGERELVCQL